MELVERVFETKFLNDTEAYGMAMKAKFVQRGATLSTATALARVAEIAYVKGAENYRTSLWHDFSKDVPTADTFVLCKSTSENGHHLFLARLVAEESETVFVDENGKKIEEEVALWMDIPNSQLI